MKQEMKPFKKNTAYFEISKSKVLSQFAVVKDHCDIVSYSSKTNPKVAGILESGIVGEKCLFSVHLVNELENITDCSRVLFLAQAWNAQKISELLSQGINWFIVDNESDLAIIKSFLMRATSRI